MRGRSGWTIVVALAALGAGLAAGTERRLPAAPAGAPDVLVIITDDQRGGMSVMPHLRRYFVRGGVRFGRAVVTTPLCCPSRTSIMTGLYAHDHGVLTNLDGTAGSVLPTLDTMQEDLHERGYVTAAFGKFLNSWPWRRPPPDLDRWAITGRVTYYDATWNIGSSEGETHGLEQIPGYDSDVLGRFIGSFIRANSDRHWFAYLDTRAPHAPYTPEVRYAHARVNWWGGDPAVRERDRSDKPPIVRRQHATIVDARRQRRRQFRTLMSVDHLLASVHRTLAETGLTRRTLIFYISDNGMMWGEHGLMNKGWPYVQNLHVPFFASWPGHLPRGVVDRRTVANIDIAPTVLAVAAGEPYTHSGRMKGRDGRVLFDRSGRLTRWRRPHGILTEHWCNNRGCDYWASILRWRRRAYTEYYSDPAKTQVVYREYYDLARDPWELHDLLHDGHGRRPPHALIRRLHLRLARWKSCGPYGSGRPTWP